ncbi:2-C-methyl-D-erythritol 4-phosphate cytidylyltransferase (EC [Olavius sp. associated proteobacterium Delta 1]|nr:2-C-methyl-D-erythritol 4-phosphate cytidylyltransferase (EC [Olavius sp. associated proteobacterium Delta 1]
MVAAVIVAAGKGIRMQDPLRKQYLQVGGLPILTHTLTVFATCDLVGHIYLVIPQDDIDYCRENILDRIKLVDHVSLVAGGSRRQESVYRGLQHIDPGCSIVIIHDGVRPIVQHDQIAACINGARKFGSCILGIPAYDTLKQVDKSGNIVNTIARDAIWLAQTPQAFRFDLIKMAHDQARLDGYQGTDDASLVERLGAAVKILRGSRSNIKITNKEDLKIARALLEKGAK